MRKAMATDPILLSVVIPCYNEAGIVARAVTELEEYLRTRDWSCGLAPTFELVFVNDGSTDGTLAELERLAALHPNLRYVSYRPCGGQGKALQTGFAHARGRWIICFDADLDYKPRYVADFLKHAVATGADIVVGSPYRPGGGIVNCPPSRLWMSKAMNWYFRRVFQSGLTTYTAILRLYRKEALDLLLLCSYDKDLLPEILIKAQVLKLHMEELPVLSIWEKKRSKERGKGIGLVSTARKAFRHLSIGLVERPFFFLFYPILVTAVLFTLMSIGIASLFVQNFGYTGSGLLVDIRSAFGQSFTESPHTFIFWLFLGQALLLVLFSGFIILQNKWKGDRDFLVQTRMYEMLRAQRDDRLALSRHYGLIGPGQPNEGPSPGGYGRSTAFLS
jgi:glycosyltransferase involved in cell wall biosynthesis